MVRVLIVDDEPDFAELLQAFVETQHYEPLVASNGEEALRLVREARPHIVLLDIRMSGMDGIEVLQRIREMDQEVGVIMVTGVEDEVVGRRALELGAFDYLVKPVDLDYLKRLLWHRVATLIA